MKNLSTQQKIMLHIIGFILGFVVATMGVFQILFLSRVIPHGGI